MGRVTFTPAPEGVNEPAPAGRLARGSAAGAGLGPALVAERLEELTATPQACAAFAAYLDALEGTGFGRRPAEAAYLASSRALIAAANGAPAPESHLEVA